MKVRVPSRRNNSAGKPGSSLLRQHLLSNDKINIIENIQVGPPIELQPTHYDPVTPMSVDEAVTETLVVSF